MIKLKEGIESTVDKLSKEVNYYYWVSNGYEDGTLFSLLWKSTISSGYDHTLTKCRDNLCRQLWVALRGIDYPNFSQAGGCPKKMAAMQDAIKGDYTKMMVVYMDEKRVGKEPESTLSIINALEEHLDHIFNGRRSFLTPTHDYRAVVFNLAKPWCAAVPLVSLVSFIIRIARNYKGSSDPLKWLLSSPTLDDPNFESDHVYLHKMYEVISAIMEQDTLDYHKLNYVDDDTKYSFANSVGFDKLPIGPWKGLNLTPIQKGYVDYIFTPHDKTPVQKPQNYIVGVNSILYWTD
jgi:hypothetical protein